MPDWEERLHRVGFERDDIHKVLEDERDALQVALDNSVSVVASVSMVGAVVELWRETMAERDRLRDGIEVFLRGEAYCYHAWAPDSRDQKHRGAAQCSGCACEYFANLLKGES